jgi:hypothetical protein
MAEPARKPAASLYDRDFVAWAAEQGHALREHNIRTLDWANLAEEIESLGGRERNEVRNRLRVLLTHLLKWEFQPEQRSHGWQSTIGEQRTHISGVIEDSPSLKSFPQSIVEDCHKWARRKASSETHLPVGTFPDQVAYSMVEILDYDFMPGRPWMPDDLS